MPVRQVAQLFGVSGMRIWRTLDHYGIQFQPGMSLFELFERYGTEEQCEAALEQVRWLDGFRCPRCVAWP